MKTFLFILLSFFYPQQSEWLRIAEEAKPELQETIVQPVTLVTPVQDPTAFQGWRMEPVDGLDNYFQVSMKQNPSVIVDFGRHMTGYYQFRLRTTFRCQDGPIRIRFTFAEVPSELCTPFDPYTGTLSRAWLQDEVITLMDIEQDIRLTRRVACRYVKIELIASSPDFDFRFADMSFAAVSSASTLPELQNKSSQSDTIARIQAVAVETLRECMQTVYEDGPKRDQRLWIGDVYLESLANTYSFRNHALTRRCLYLLAGLAAEDGRLHGNVFERPEPHPQVGSHPEDYALLYNVTLLNYLRASGDTATARDLYPVAVRQMEYALSVYGQYDGHWLFFDWRDAVEKTAAMECLTVFALHRSADLAETLGDKAQAKAWRTRAAQAKRQIRRDFLNTQTHMLADRGQYNEITQTWAVLSGVLSPKEGKLALTAMKQRPEVIRLGTPYANHYYVEALIACGMNIEARRHVIDYWGGMVAKGADTFWEVYDPANEYLSPYNFFPVNSYCHAWSCTPVYFIQCYPDIFQ